MQTTIISVAICLTFYVLGAYATTDILRLLKGCDTPITAPDCYCPICNNKIRLRDQLPIFSYFKNHGACPYCNSSIPVSNLFLEVFLFTVLSLTSILLRFRWSAFFLCIVIFEGTKLVALLRYGHRETAFAKNFIRSLLNNLLLFLLLAFLFLLYQII